MSRDNTESGSEQKRCENCGDPVDITIREGGSHKPIGPYPIRVCNSGDESHIHYLGEDGDRDD